MAKHLTLGNGSLLVGFDRYAQIKDLYFHYPGLENHISETMTHKIGFWVDNSRFSWLDDNTWDVSIDCERGTMAGVNYANNPALQLEVDFNDVVYNEKNIIVRKVIVKNLAQNTRKIKIFFNQQFNISQTYTGDTAYYDPEIHSIIHYKGRRVFLINAMSEKGSFSEFSTGLFGIEGKTGTYKDAEDGFLEGNPIEHGQVDSIIGVDLEVKGNGEETVYYWMCVTKSIKEAKKNNEYVLTKTPHEIIKSTKDYWKAWVYNQSFSFYGLSDQIIDLFNKSLIQIRTHVGRNGSIIASGDSDMLQFGRDTYSYIWPRDASFGSIALAKAGDFNASKRFFEFCSEVITDQGYFMHKYTPDHSLGSSWHPWILNGKPRLPIQEDETALVIWALWVHYQLSKDLEFVEGIYNSLIKSAAEFMVEYRDKKTGLPLPSYDLWEERYGVHTFTASSVYGALIVASKFAKMLGKTKYALRYSRAADSIKAGIMKYLYNESEGVFYRSVNFEENEIKVDKTIDASSWYGIYKFGLMDHTDPRLKIAIEKTYEALWVSTNIGGFARYSGDNYLRASYSVPGNPWVITSLWYVQYMIDKIKAESDLPELVSRFTWFVDHALPSGVLSEQINPHTGEPISAAPLTWSHAEYVITIIKYLEKLEELNICKACYPLQR